MDVTLLSQINFRLVTPAGDIVYLLELATLSLHPEAAFSAEQYIETFRAAGAELHVDLTQAKQANTSKPIHIATIRKQLLAPELGMLCVARNLLALIMVLLSVSDTAATQFNLDLTNYTTISCDTWYSLKREVCLVKKPGSSSSSSEWMMQTRRGGKHTGIPADAPSLKQDHDKYSARFVGSVSTSNKRM